MNGMYTWSEPTGTLRVSATKTTSPRVLLEFGPEVAVWLRPSEAQLLLRDLAGLLDALAAA